MSRYEHRDLPVVLIRVLPVYTSSQVRAIHHTTTPARPGESQIPNSYSKGVGWRNSKSRKAQYLPQRQNQPEGAEENVLVPVFWNIVSWWYSQLSQVGLSGFSLILHRRLTTSVKPCPRSRVTIGIRAGHCPGTRGRKRRHPNSSPQAKHI